VSTAGTVSSEAAADRADAHGWRLVTAKVLVVVVSVLAVLSVVAGYVRYQALDTPTVRSAAGELIADPAVRTELAATLVDQLYANVDVAGALQQRLPPDQQALAAPIAGALRELANRAAVTLLERPRIQALWVNSVAVSHQELLKLLNDRGTALRTANGNVVLNLRPLVIQLGDRVAIVGRLADRLPPNAAQITIVKSDNLRMAQRATHALEVAGRFLWILTLALAAVAVWLARGRRRSILKALAIGVIVAGFAVLMIRRVAGNYVVDSLVPTGTTREAVQQSWTILTALLRDGGWTLTMLGALTLIGIWFTGEGRSSTASRRELAPLFARNEIVYGAAATFVLLLVWWGPTVQFHRVQFVVAFAILLGLGMWALRRIVVAEHPEAGNEPAGLPFTHAWSALRGHPDGHPSTTPPPPADGL
jgi:hypothetical protein